MKISRKRNGTWNVYTIGIFACALAYFYSVTPAFAWTFDEAGTECDSRAGTVSGSCGSDYIWTEVTVCNHYASGDLFAAEKTRTGECGGNQSSVVSVWHYTNHCTALADEFAGYSYMHYQCYNGQCVSDSTHPSSKICRSSNCNSTYVLEEATPVRPRHHNGTTYAVRVERYEFTYDGEMCIYEEPPADDDSSQPPEEPSCGPDQTMGNFNNQVICINNDGSVDSTDNSDESGIDVTDGAVPSTESTQTETNTTDGNGNATNTNTTTYDDGTTVTDTTISWQSGGSTTTSTRNNPGGGSSVTTTTTDANGNSTTTVEEIGTVCEIDPGNPACSESSAKGVCDSPFHCRGDPIQCIQAKYLFELKCAGQPSEDEKKIIEKVKPAMDETSLIGTYSAALNPLNPENIEELDVTNEIDSSGFLSGGGCPLDPVVNVLGTSITLPFSVVCPYLEMIGNIMVVVASIIAIMIIGS